MPTLLCRIFQIRVQRIDEQIVKIPFPQITEYIGEQVSMRICEQDRS